ncbi:MAG: sigma 54-interacting transcriptional regulator [Planctomycetes bacterium]|nr:sigma 54-interacting transcriptional regulator [Planctomycetota bacterium]
MPRFIVHAEGERRELAFDKPSILIGRGSGTDLRIGDRLASRAHARIDVDGNGHAVVVDVGSQNGTFLNGQQILNADLRSGDVVSIGTTRIYYEREPDPNETSLIARPTLPNDDLVRRLTRERSNHLRLQRISQALSTESDVEKLLTLVVDSLIELAGAERGFLILREAEQALHFVAARNFDGDQVPEPELAISRSIAQRVLESGKSLLSVNAGDDQRFEGVQSITNLGLRSVLVVPLTAQGETIGAVYVDHRMTKGAFDEEDLRLAEAFAGQAAVAVHRARLVTHLVDANKQLEESQERVRLLNEELKRRVAVQEVELVEVRARLRERAAAGGNDYSRIVGRSKPMMDIFRLLDRVVASDFPVHVFGESGTGKELIARAIHENGPRAGQRFVSENCAALPDSLLESELFGYERGAFTGARQSKKGLLQMAHKGTLFLDEVGDMSPDVQKKLLRFLQEGEFRPVGGRESVHVDVRIISASNKDLAEIVAKGEFREDLMYRLNVLPMRLPPLRDRKDDIPLLADTFLKRFGRESGRAGIKMRPEVLDALCAYHWPGNVRELENEIRMLITFSDDPITLDRLSERIRRALSTPAEPALREGLTGRVEALERAEIRRALEDATGNKSRAADVLGISRFALQRKLEKYRIGADGRPLAPGETVDGGDEEPQGEAGAAPAAAGDEERDA